MCQLRSMDSLGIKNSWLNDKHQLVIRKYRFYKKTLLRNLRSTKNPGKSIVTDADMKPGDLVRIRSKAEIQGVLDRFRKTCGCTFQMEMFQHCGKEYRIFKKVDHFFDETKQKMCRCRDMYLLDGCCCSGKTAYLKPCDRNCFFFWHAAWLEKINL